MLLNFVLQGLVLLPGEFSSSLLVTCWAEGNTACSVLSFKILSAVLPVLTITVEKILSILLCVLSITWFTFGFFFLGFVGLSSSVGGLNRVTGFGLVLGWLGWVKLGIVELGWDKLGWDKLGWDKLGWDKLGWAWFMFGLRILSCSLLVLGVLKASARARA